MSPFIRFTPFIHVPDLETAVRFFTDILGFSRYPLPYKDYAYVYRDQLGVRLLGPQPGEKLEPGTRRFAYYVDVHDIDALYAELKPALDTLPPGDVMGPFNQPYFQRELLVLVPDGNLMVFGQAIAQPN
jgi:catechol 2,3-dioxygenase-like lactoylglutathione lyase family enzyme